MFNYVAIYFIYIKKTIVVTFCNNRSLHASSLRNVAGTKNCRLWEIYDLDGQMYYFLWANTYNQKTQWKHMIWTHTPTNSR